MRGQNLRCICQSATMHAEAHLSARFVRLCLSLLSTLVQVMQHKTYRAQWFRYNLADLPDLMVSTVVAMGGIEPPSILMFIAINPWLRVEGTTVGLTHPYPILTGDVSSLCFGEGVHLNLHTPTYLDSLYPQGVGQPYL